MPNLIGTLNEKSLHAALKQWYAQPKDLFEAPVDGFIVDIVRGDLLIEIQTRNLSTIRCKLTTLAHVCGFSRQKRAKNRKNPHKH